MKKFGTLSKDPFHPPPLLSRGGGFNPFKEKEAPLTGKVQNLKAAEGEERLARAIEKGIKKGIVKSHKFRWTTLKRGTVGYKELDELIFLTNGRVVAVSVKGETFVHHGSAAIEQDKINEALQLSTLRKMGWDTPAIVTVAADKLNTQEDADKEAKKLGAYR